jgi:hypothetical protein
LVVVIGFGRLASISNKNSLGLGYFALVLSLGGVAFWQTRAVTSAFAMSAIALWGTLNNLGRSRLPTESISLIAAGVLGHRYRDLPRHGFGHSGASTARATAPYQGCGRVESWLNLLGMTDAAPKIVQAMCEAEWELGAIWNVDRPSDQLTCIDFWSLPSVNVAAFEALTRQASFPAVWVCRDEFEQRQTRVDY